MEIRSDHGLRTGAVVDYFLFSVCSNVCFDFLVLTVCKQWIAMSGTHPKGGKGSSKRPPFRLAKQTEVDDDSAATTPARASQQQSAGGTSTAAKQQQQQKQPPPPPSEEPPAERRSSSDGSRPPTTPTTKAQISCGRVQSKNNSPKNSKPLSRGMYQKQTNKKNSTL
ncbi:hypothetical protein D917_01504 [Trichinella nativa]|uniref:Uncharacterized protein n=1 Tax=Trichinella nativa TaxID=6335 RepID=A0A1Y3EPP3_9BILA|nr:hypothetical protein D917_01504 [Trichinella nativa]